MITTPTNRQTPLDIAPACTADAGPLLAFLDIVTGESDMLASGTGEMRMTLDEEETFIKRMDEADNSVLLLGKMEGEIVATASITGGPRLRSHHTGEIGLSVKKNFWRQGVGQSMMQALLDWARASGTLTHLNLLVRRDNHRAIVLYQRFGFANCGCYPGFMKIDGAYYDGMLMTLVLEQPPQPGSEGLAVREAAAGDLFPLLELYRHLHDEVPPQPSPSLTALWQQMMCDPNQHILLVWKDNILVSSCTLVITPNLTRKQRPWAVIENVVTHPDHRRHGYATMALNKAREVALGHNCYKIMLMTSRKDPGTLAFYNSAGYTSKDKTAFVQRF